MDGVDDTSFNDHAFTRFIDPRSESTDGVSFDLGIDEVTLVFSEQVRDVSETGLSEVLSPSSFYVLETGGAAPPSVTQVCRPDPSLQTWSATLTLSRVITLREWTSIVAVVEDMDDNPIDGSDRVIIGFLPGDVDQDGVVGPFDLLRFRQYANKISTPSGKYGLPGTVMDYIDTNRDGTFHPFDLLRFRQLVNGISPPSTQGWNGVEIDADFPLCCR